MRRLVILLVALVALVGCNGTGGGSDVDEGAGERPAKLKRCEPGETEQVGESEDAGGPGTASQGFGGIELRTNGDVVGFVEDEQCRVRVGYVETPQDLKELEKGLSKRAYDQEIPFSNFDMISDTQQFFLNNAGNPYGGNYTAKLLVREVDSLQEGGEGENAPPYATVELRSYREGRITSKAIFRDFPAPLGARLQLTFPATLARNAREADPKNLRLLIDENADLFVDEAHPPSSLVAGPAAGETDPPRTSATVRKGPTPDEVLVELAADDAPDGEYESGEPGAKASSGGHQIYYAVKPPNGGADSVKTEEYVGPFSVPLGSTVYYYSVDRAGNFDTPRQVVADEGSIGTTTSEPMDRS